MCFLFWVKFFIFVIVKFSVSFIMAFWNKDNDGSQTLSDLIRGLQHSVNAAMEMIETRNIELLARYFTEDGVPLKKRIVAQAGFSTGETEVPFDNRLKRSKLEVSFDGKNDHSSMHVKIKFEATPIPEGLSRLVDEYDKTISSFEIGDPTSEK